MRVRKPRPAIAKEITDRSGHLIWRAQQNNWRIFVEEASHLDVTPVQANVILIIGDRPGIDQKGLAAMIALDKATTGNVVSRLEERKLLVRKASKVDGRAWAHFLTSKGKKSRRQLYTVMPRIREKALSHLTSGERRQLIRLLQKMLQISC
jgi:DNA-binding MarR family transcriptional regulator